MHHSVIAPLALLGSAVALHQTTTLFIPGFDQQPLVASIAGSDSTATTYAIKCAPGTSSDECGAGAGFTLIEGPKTAHMEMIDGDASIFSLAENCVLKGTSTAICTNTAAGSEANFPGTSTLTYANEDLASAMIVVTVTAGDVNTAPASTAASATAPTATATAASTSTAAGTGSDTTTATGTIGSTSTSGSASTGTTTGTSTGAASSSADSSSVSTGGLPRITGNVELAIGGAAVVMALAGF
ncbi:uncharacterized protein TRUGW13939_01174 [Talaromyces rugulosus]|uniref:GPI anchored cell wall protein n=1 Tax=Talaromyces rugulosus TaxID=121627 RepID=A0A7H8QKM6_TALRU|nr:uncharacterized protein TRUGW13939_01174 [Talaromyces rugulosus]QKX54091.1 hypothetical protein TRUGW13939_01174 [Talaromyces rugulosus]